MEDTLAKFFFEINNSLPDEGLGLLAAACMRALSSVDKGGFSEKYFIQSIGTAYELSYLRMNAEFISASLLYYPVSSGALLIHEVTNDFGQRILRAALPFKTTSRNLRHCSLSGFGKNLLIAHWSR